MKARVIVFLLAMVLVASGVAFSQHSGGRSGGYSSPHTMNQSAHVVAPRAPARGEFHGRIPPTHYARYFGRANRFHPIWGPNHRYFFYGGFNFGFYAGEMWPGCWPYDGTYVIYEEGDTYFIEQVGPGPLCFAPGFRMRLYFW